MVPVETEPRTGHVKAPDPGGTGPDFGDGFLPVRVQVRAPGGERHRVVLAEVFLVPDLKPGVGHQRNQVAGTLQLAVREDVAVDETALTGGGLDVVRPGDAVIQQAALRPELAEQEREVIRKLPHADVLGEPDRADRVEAGLADIPVVEVADLGQAGQSGFLDGLLGPGRLLCGQRDPERADAVFPGRVHDHAAPAAADVEQPHPAAQPELACDQVELVLLRLLQGGLRSRVTGAGVGH